MGVEEKVNKDSLVKEANEEAIDIDLNDPEVEAAATKIQAGFKGHRARKDLKESKVENTVDDSNALGIVLDGRDIEEKEDFPVKEANDEVIDIDLNDPEVEAAATKIQAGFQGHKARKELKRKKEENPLDYNNSLT